MRKAGTPGGPVYDFTGWVKRSGGLISFAIKTRALSGPRAAFTGTWEYVPARGPIPENTSLVGWKIFDANGTPLDISANDTIDTVGALQARYPADGPRQ